MVLVKRAGQKSNAGLLPVMSVGSVTTWSRPDPNARNMAVEGPYSASYRKGENPTSVERPILSRFGVTGSCCGPRRPDRGESDGSTT